KKHKKTRKHQAKPEKRVRIVFMSLHNYSRKQCAICFERSEGRTGQNSKLSHQKTVNGTRNFFAFREALAGSRGAVPTRFVEPHRVAKGCPLWHK
ncbi:hypothetical protein DSF19_23345, partial [Salmonella enterica subsp. enterica serovar Newport]|nr:hypothetical protein [Salmonella enterica subsp. enterica serovar Newport]